MYVHTVYVCVCVSGVSPERLCVSRAALCCFRLRSKFNKLGLTYANVLYKQRPAAELYSHSAITTAVLPPCACVPGNGKEGKTREDRNRGELQ